MRRGILIVVAKLFTASVVVAQSAASGPDPVLAGERARIELVARLSPAVVCIFDAAQMGGGSGVIIDPQGYGLTNFHVVAPMLDSRRGKAGLPDGQLYDLEVLGIDVTGDVAMFKLNGRDDFPFVALGDSGTVRVGDRVIAMGNPFVLSDDYTPTVTMGVVSGVHRYQWGVNNQLVYTDCIQTDAAINPGNSGGPLFDLTGRVIGVNGRISVATRGRHNVGLGYAISINQIKRFIPTLRAGQLAMHGTMQATVLDGKEGSVVFDQLLDDGPAWSAGIRPGDRLLTLDAEPIDSANEFISLMGTYPQRWPVAVEYEHEQSPGRSIVRLEPVSPRLEHPFETDPAINRREVERVLREHAEAFGGPPSLCDARITRRRLDGAADAPPEVLHLSAVAEGPFTLSSPGRDAIEYDDAGARRVTSSGKYDLPVSDAMVYRALYAAQRRLPGASKAQLPEGVRHLGADVALETDADGRVAWSEAVEVLLWPLGETVEAEFGFDLDDHSLKQIVVRDVATGEHARLALVTTVVEGAPRSKRVVVQTNAGGYVDEYEYDCE